MVYIIILSVNQVIWDRMVGRSKDDEGERIWKEVVAGCLKILSRNLPGSRRHGRDFNRAPSGIQAKIVIALASELGSYIIYIYSYIYLLVLT
jgi:hypothetical protein